jgi:hypothetical protein
MKPENHKPADYFSYREYYEALAFYNAEERLEQRKASVARKIAWREAGPKYGDLNAKNS